MKAEDASDAALPCVDDLKLIEEIEESLRRLAEQPDRHSVAVLDARLRALPDGAANPKVIGLIVQLCTLWLHLGEAGCGLEVSNKAVQWARLISDASSLRRALNTRAALKVDLLDIAGSMQDLLDALQVAETSNEVVGIVTSYHNISVNLMYLEMSRLSIEFAELGLETVRKRADSFPSGVASLHETILEYILACAHFENGGLQTTLSKLQHVQSTGGQLLPSLEPNDRLQLLVYLHNARCVELEVALRLGMLDHARRLAPALRDGSRALPNSAKLYTRKALAELAAAEGRYAEAIAELQELLRDPLAPRQGFHAALSLAECYSKVGRHADAMEILRTSEVEMQLRRSMVAVERLRSRIAGGGLSDTSFEQEVDDSVSRTRVSMEADEMARASRLSSLVAMAISAEANETLSVDGIWHPIRVGALARMLASRLGLSDTLCRQAEVAGWLHDLGKCAIPDRIKLKAGPLTDEEWRLTREHPELGARLIDALGDRALADAIAAVRHHHERFDGNGYPDGLAGDEIPVVARVVSLAESFDAMLMSKRYRPCRTLGEAMAEVGATSGTKFDPGLMAAFREAIHQLGATGAEVQRQLEQLGKASASVESFERVEQLVSPRRRIESRSPASL